MKSFSAADSQIFNNSVKDDYWVQKVNKLMKEKRQVMKVIKERNSEIKRANDEKQRMAREMKH